jgi:hypothetical protein
MSHLHPKRFRAKWVPVRVKKTRQNEMLLEEILGAMAAAATGCTRQAAKRKTAPLEAPFLKLDLG